MADALAPEPQPTRRRRAGRIALFVVLGVVVLLVVLVVVAEFVLRGVVNRVIEQQVDKSLPAGTTGQVHATAHGLIIPQLISGDLSDVDLESNKLTVQGIPLGVHATAKDIPISGSGSVGSVDGTVTLAAGAVKDLAKYNAIFDRLSLRDGGVALTGTTSVLGFDVDYSAEGTIAAQSSGKGVTIMPKKVSITGGSGAFSVSKIPGVTDTPVNVCTAGFMPKALLIKSLDITKARASVRVTADALPLSASALQETGSCS
jgi:hypothetical protein